MIDQQIERVIDDYDRGRLSRRQLVARLSGAAAALALVPRPVAAQPTGTPTFTATDLNHIALRVTDIGRSREFYQRHLGLTVASEGRTSCFLRCADSNFVALFKSERPAMDHYCYSIRNYEPGEVVQKLEAAELKPRRAGNRVYFDDPDGLEVQVAARTHGV